jgi:hypothetical protein
MSAEIGFPCPICTVPVQPGEPFCEACAVGLVWSADASATPRFPEIASGRPLWGQGFETSPLPGRPALEEVRNGVRMAWPVPGGKMVVFPTATTAVYVDYARHLRDACVRADFTPLDPGARIGLAARHSILGAVQMYYLFDIMPLAGRAWFARAVQAPGEAMSTRLGREARFEPIPLRATIELELRVAGATMQAFIGRRNVLSAHDAAFGSGSFGIRVGREHEVSHDVHVVCHGYQVCEVAP